MSRSDSGNPSPPPLDDLPPALSSMWRVCKLGFQYEPSLGSVVDMRNLTVGGGS